MLMIDLNMIDNGIITETGLFDLATEASSLGLKPGEFPRKIETTLGNQQPFWLTQPTTEKFALYIQDLGPLRLKVFND